MSRTRPELKVWNKIKDAEDALSTTEIHQRTGMNFNTVKSVIESLKEMERIEEVQTNSYTYYQPKEMVA